MNIAHIVSSAAVFPLQSHHGRYEWALRIAKAQAAQGHTVTIYCGANSGEGIPEIRWASVPYNFGNKTIQDVATIKMALDNKEHDIFHSHLDFLHYLVADTTKKPIIFTEHWFPSEKIGRAAQFNTSRNALAVPVTKFMQAENKRLNIPDVKMIYHGIDLNKFAFSDKPRSNRFVFVGRIAPHKGVDRVVEIAKAANVPLDIVGKINDEDQEYWQTISPSVDGQQIRYLGSKNHDEIANIFSQAKALLFAPQIVEAFGQTIIEAQACGTPVIINNVGAAHELVDQGKTGFIANSIQEFLDAINKVGSINSADCRTFAKQFDINKMIAAYETLYKNLIERC